jgi:hypothetical protein
MDRLRAVHEKAILKLSRDLEQDEADLSRGGGLLAQLRHYGPYRLKSLAAACAMACVVFIGLALSSLLWLAPAVIAAVGSCLFLVAVPGARTNDRVEERRRQIEAMRKLHREIEDQRPEITLTEADMDAILNEALDNLVRDEKQRLEIRPERPGEYAGPRAETFGPMMRWALETDRKRWLDAALESEDYKPPVHWAARRGGHYVRYDVKVIFVHHGQLTQYQGFYDLVQGEWMGVTRKHIVLANLFSIEDETAEDFDFRQTVRDRIDKISESESKRGGVGEEPSAEIGEAAARNEGIAEENDPDLINLTQTTVVRFIGSGESVELKFVASGQKKSLIAELRRRREEQELAASADAASDLFAGEVDSAKNQHELMSQLAKLDEAEARVLRTKTIDDVGHFINQILAHTRWTFSERHVER